MITVLFIRHAEAADKLTFSGPDMSRPLTAGGVKTASRFFKALARLYPVPDVIFSSKAVRARQTADLLAKAFKGTKVKESELLNPGAGHDDFRKLIALLSPDTALVAVVGHEPDFSRILAYVISDGILRIDVKKASCIEADVNRLGRGELRQALLPKAVKALCA